MPQIRHAGNSRLRILALSIFLFAAPKTEAALSHPAWSLNQPIYHVNLAMFSSAGTFAALQARLPEIKALGVGILWVMPFMTRGVTMAFGSPYCIRDYQNFHAPIGNATDFQNLVNAVHAQGMKIIIDWVANHTAWDHPWISSNPEYYVQDGMGNIQQAYSWTDVAQLDYTVAAMQTAMIDAMKYWVQTYDVDGFRCDVAWAIPTSFWNSARVALDAIKPVYMLAENNNPSYATAFDSDYDWNLVRPVTQNGLTDIAQGLSPATRVDACLALEGGYPSDFMRMRFTSNYDEWKDFGTPFMRLGAGVQALAVLMSTLKGKPMIYNGQEVGWNVQAGPITWNSTSPYIDFYRLLFQLHQLNPAMHAGSFTKLPSSQDSRIYSFARQSGTSRVLVFLNLSSVSTSFTVNHALLGGSYTELFKFAPESLGASYSDSFGPWQYKVLVSGPLPTAATSTPTPLIASENARVLLCLPSLNPQAGSRLQLSVKLQGQSSGLCFRVYGSGATLIQEYKISGQRGPGWHSMELPWEGQANGLFYVKARSEDESAFSLPASRVMFLR